MYPNTAADNGDPPFTVAAAAPDLTTTGSGGNSITKPHLLENTGSAAIYSPPDSRAGTVEMMDDDDANPAGLSGLTTAIATETETHQQQQQQRSVSYNKMRRNRRWKFLHHGIHMQTMVFDTPCSTSSTSSGSGTTETTTAAAPTNPIPESTMLKLKRPNWGSDTRFRIDAATTTSSGNRCRSSYYAVPKDQPTEAEATARILRNSAELIRDTSWIAQVCETSSPSLSASIDDMNSDSSTNDENNDKKKEKNNVTPKGQGRPRTRTRKRARAELQTESQRRECHVRSEQVRRNLVNSGFHELKMLVPGLRYQAYSKAQTLRVVCEWIEELVSGNEALREVLRGLEEEEQEQRQGQGNGDGDGDGDGWWLDGVQLL